MSPTGGSERRGRWDVWSEVSAEQALAQRWLARVEVRVGFIAFVVLVVGCLATALVTRTTSGLAYLPGALFVALLGIPTWLTSTRRLPPEAESALTLDDVPRLRRALRAGDALTPTDRRLGLALRGEAERLERASRWLALAVVVTVVIAALAVGRRLAGQGSGPGGGIGLFSLVLVPPLVALLVTGRRLGRETAGIEDDGDDDA